MARWWMLKRVWRKILLMDLKRLSNLIKWDYNEYTSIHKTKGKPNTWVTIVWGPFLFIPLFFFFLLYMLYSFRSLQSDMSASLCIVILILGTRNWIRMRICISPVLGTRIRIFPMLGMRIREWWLIHLPHVSDQKHFLNLLFIRVGHTIVVYNLNFS